MGERKKPKKYHKMGYQQKEAYVKSELQKLGGGAVYYDNGGARGSSSTGMFDLEASEAQLKKLASNDYDRRESIKYGKDSGDKRFKDVGNGGFGSMSELVNADRAIAKYGYNELEHKNMSSDNDYAAVSSSLFNKSRVGLTKDMSTENQQADAKDSEPYIPSKEMSDAKSRVEEFDNKDYGVYGNSEAGDNKDQRTKAAGSFLEKYKLDVKEGAAFKPTI